MENLASADALSVIGFFLTLTGLLGTFFYIHLSDWLRDVIALETKWKINRIGDEPDQKAARRQCRYEVEQLGNWVTLVTSVVISLFVIVISVLSAILWINQTPKTIAWMSIGFAGGLFVIIYSGMTIFLLVTGFRKASRLRREIEATLKPSV